MSVSLSRVDGPGDAELIAAVRGGDVDAYGELFARHVDAARRLAGQLAGPGDADDLVSDAFTKVLTVLQRGGGPDLAFRAYLLTAVRRLHVDRIRSGSRLRPVDDLTPFDPGVPFHDTAVEGFDNATAAKAFASLPERWQMVLWHTEVEQQKPADIAVLLGMSANSVSALAYRAREGLRQAFLSMHAADPDDVDCGWTRDHLGAYVRGGLSRRDVARVDDHLEDCRACAAVYLELTEVNSGLSALLAPLLLGTAGAAYLSSGGAPAAAAPGSRPPGRPPGPGSAATPSSRRSAASWPPRSPRSRSTSAPRPSWRTRRPTPRAWPTTRCQSVSQSGQPGTSGPGQGPGSRGTRDAQPTRRAGSTRPRPVARASVLRRPFPRRPTPRPTRRARRPPTRRPTPAPTPVPAPATAPAEVRPTRPRGRPARPTREPIRSRSPRPRRPTRRSARRTGSRRPGDAGKGIVFSIDPATTHRACSLDDAGTTVTFDHAGTCVIAAHATTRSAARSLVARAAAGDATQTVQVPKGRQHLDFQLDGSVQVGDRLPLSVTRGASGQPVTFTVDNPDVCAINGAGTALTFQHARPCTVTAHEDGDADYHPARDLTRTIDVGQGDQQVGFTFTSDRAVVSGTGTLAVTAQGGSGNPVTFTSTTPEACTVAGTTVTFGHAQAVLRRGDTAGERRLQRRRRGHPHPPGRQGRPAGRLHPHRPTRPSSTAQARSR